MKAIILILVLLVTSCVSQPENSIVKYNQAVKILKTNKSVKLNEEAFGLFMAAAEKGVAEASYVVGFAYNFGFGVNKDLSKAAFWYLEAAKKENIPAMFGYALLKDEDDGLARNSEEIVKWYKKASMLGHSTATYNIAYLYQQGVDVKKDVEFSEKLYSASSEQGGELDAEKFCVQMMFLELDELRVTQREYFGVRQLSNIYSPR